MSLKTLFLYAIDPLLQMSRDTPQCASTQLQAVAAERQGGKSFGGIVRSVFRAGRGSSRPHCPLKIPGVKASALVPHNRMDT